MLRLLVGKLTWVVSQIDNSLGSRLGKVSDFCRVEQLFELVHVIVVFFLRHVQIHVEAKLVDVFLPRLEGGASPLGHWIDVARLVLILVMVLVLVVEAATELRVPTEGIHPHRLLHGVVGLLHANILHQHGIHHSWVGLRLLLVGLHVLEDFVQAAENVVRVDSFLGWLSWLLLDRHLVCHHLLVHTLS